MYDELLSFSIIVLTINIVDILYEQSLRVVRGKYSTPVQFLCVIGDMFSYSECGSCSHTYSLGGALLD